MFKVFWKYFLPVYFCLAGITPSHAQDSFPEFNFTGYADARLSYSNGEPSFFQNGHGKTRYGSDASGNDETRFNLAEAALLVETKFSWELSSFLNLKFDPEQKNNIDVVEAFLTYNDRFPSGDRITVRLGTFFPHISLENHDIAWTSPYSITSSAINSWIGEEIKTTGLEIAYEKEFEEHAISINGGLFGVNDTAGSLLAYRGWALQDSKATIFGEVPLPAINSIGPTGMFNQQSPFVVPHTELDNRIGYFAGFSWEYFGFLTFNGLYYDNRGDPDVIMNGQYAWETDFLNLGLSIDHFEDIEIFGQFLKGNTKMGPSLDILSGNTRPVDVDYESFYILVSKTFDIHRITFRYDNFSTTDNSLVVEDNNNETGDAWLLAYSAEVFENQKLILEFLRVNSDRASRVDLGLPTKSKETQIQASYRITF